MACDTRLKPQQTISERIVEVRKAIERLADAIRANRIKIVIDRATGAPAISGWDETSRDGITDGCALRLILKTGNGMARELVAKAEAMAGRPMNKQAMAQGHHSHDGGQTWHKH